MEVEIEEMEYDCDERQPLEPLKEFIMALESLQELWDYKHPMYTNKYKRNENLAILLPILKKMKPDSTLEDVKKKINTLRSVYRREIKKMRADEEYYPKIWYYPLLHFLSKFHEPVAVKRESINTIKAQSTPTRKHIKRQTEKRKNRKKMQYQLPSDDSQYFDKPISQYSQSPRQIPKSTVNLPIQPSQISSNHTPNTQFKYLRHPIALEWSHTLERLDQIQRIYAKKAINDVLFEAELGNLSRDSVSINVTDSSARESAVVYTSAHYSHSSHNSSNHSDHDLSNDSTLPSPISQSPKMGFSQE